MRRTIVAAAFFILLAAALWGAFGYLAYSLRAERTAYATLLADAEMKETRERAVSRLRGSVRDTREDREALEALIAVDVIQAVSTVEAVGPATKTRVKIDGASGGPGNEHVRTIIVAVTLEGKLQSVLDAITVLETLPFPALIDHVDLFMVPDGKDTWTARLKTGFITTSTIGV